MPTPLGFPDPPDSTRLALVFSWMRQLATAIDTYLRGTDWTTPTAGSGINLNPAGLQGTRWRLTSGLVTLNIELGAPGAGLAANAVMLTVQPDARPSRRQAVLLTTGGATFKSWAFLGTNGELRCPVIINSNEQIIAQVTYPAA